MIFPVYPITLSKFSGELFFLSFLYLCRRKKVLIGLLLKVVLTLSSFLVGSSYQCTSSILLISMPTSLRQYCIAFKGNLLSCLIPVNLSSSAAAITLLPITIDAAES